ncbi:P-loop containing nucleoside triphosphate hydrolase protein [Jaminaea rosea]|uniref:P-loop containing nucleoside triphosphate hydrolase protein n=1 Tax=Jaminaea rosea TaxID=1569628 RepID=A0A316URL8_9BASI|nr:P-loop containing nucleoside triphosphate hydrolase protein [Jaminaea rosea]PWN27927.1 P-loop containing nucleoside triphosphate hydrolase protein [Jaminaea rosea]
MATPQAAAASNHRPEPADFQSLNELLAQRKGEQLPDDAAELARALASRWLTKAVVKPVTVDLVTSFAVQELVAVDGDALLSLCFDYAASLTGTDSHKQLGSHPITLIFILEQVLARLRGAHLFFKIVWFQDRASVGTAASSSSSACETASRRFIRSAVRAHLDSLDLVQDTFPSIDSDEWRSWLNLERPYAILTTDGSQGGSGLREARDTLALAQHLGGGFKGDSYAVSVVLMDKAMFHDHKIFAFLIETGPLISHAVKLQSEHYQTLAFKLAEEQPKGAETASLPAPPSGIADLTLAEQVALATSQNSQAEQSHRIALILAAVLIARIPLSQRALKLDATSVPDAASHFLAAAYDAGVQLLATFKGAAASVDIIDPRLFAFLATNLGSVASDLPNDVLSRAQELAQKVGISGVPSGGKESSSDAQPTATGSQAKLLPYNPSAKLDLPQLPTSPNAAAISEQSTFIPYVTAAIERAQLALSSTFSQYKRSSKEKVARDAHGRIINKLASRRFKADQRYANTITLYAQSLLGSAGLIRQVITEGVQNASVVVDKKQLAAGNGKEQSGKDKKAGKAADTGKKLSKKEQIIAQNQARKSDKASASVERKLTYLLEELEIGPAVSKFDSADSELLAERRRLLPALQPYIAGAASAEAARDLRLLKVRLALEGWVCACTIEKKDDAFDLAVTAFTEVGQILSITPASGFSTHERALLTSCGQALRVLGLQGVYGPSHAGLEAVWDEVEEKKGKPAKKGEFPFDVNWPRASKKYTVGDPIDFQLSHCGDVMERQLDSKADRRVATFKPDGWQRKVLDAVDARDSLLVVAPTSAGKTFIAFYVIEKALRESSDAVVVYVAPSKALVNQIAAELEARYSKNYGALERSIWCISTGEFDVHNPLKAQVLVADPSVLHKMCLSSDVAGSWLPRVKAVIVDEVHTLTDKEHGPTQQQLLALVPAPIIALSATVGNVGEFGDWMGKIRARHGQKLSVIEHPTRYSDLKKHVFLPPKSEGTSESFKGVTKPLDTKSMFRHLHPFSALRPLGASLPSDLEMTPAEQLQLVRKMQKYANPEAGYAIGEDLDPQTFFGDIVGPLARSHTLKYQAELRKVTLSWMSQPNSRAPGSPFIKVIDALEGNLTSKLDAADSARVGGISHLDFHKEHLLPLLAGLHQSVGLPAICFNFDRDIVETLGRHVIETLTSGEAHFKGTNKTWLAKVAEWNAWQDDEPARKKADEKRLKAIKGREEAEALKKDAQKSDAGWQASFDPEAPLPDYTFANEKCGLALEDVGPEANSLPNVEQYLKDGLIRGVAIHHSGMPLRYRQTVERWFRKGWLRVVISTGTLALGINMPAKTSVFVGDHVELNALQYRQAAGRAGRRGMDLAGNVFFYGIPMKKIQRLLTSRLPSLDCDFPSSATLNLRLHSLLSGGEAGSKQVGEKMLSSVLGLEVPPTREQEMPLVHQFRASVEFLRRFGLMSSAGEPLALSGLAGHLATEEPANLAFLELLRSGCLYNIAMSAEADRPAAVDEFVTVLSHLFASRAVSPTSRYEGGKDALPPLSEEPRKVIEKLAQQAKAAFVDYASSVAGEDAVEAKKDTLPYSQRTLGGSDKSAGSAFSGSALPHNIRSSYLAPSGLNDSFTSSGPSLSDDVLFTIRSGLRLTPGVVPDFGRLLDDARSPRNSYILDFFKWGSLEAMTTVNGIPAGERWYVLRDFWQTLTSLRSCLELILKTGAKAQAQGLTAANSGEKAGKAGAAKKGGASNGAALDSWEFDPPEIETYQGYDDGEGNDKDDIDERSTAYEYKTDSGVAGSQLSGGGARALSGPAVHRAGQLRTRSGKVMEPIAPPIELPAELTHPQLYAVYKLLWDVMDRYYSFYVPTFA